MRPARLVTACIAALLQGMSPGARAQSFDTAPGAQSTGAPECSADTGEPVRRRPGQPPSNEAAPDCDPERLPLTDASRLPSAAPADRWRVVEQLGVPDNWLDPYATNNPLKGDRPMLMQDDFFELTAASMTLIEQRRVPTTPDGAPGRLLPRAQSFDSQTLSIDGVGYQGDTVFRPPDYEFRFTPIFNYSSTQTAAMRASSSSVGAQALFFEMHLRDVSPQYDFDSVRIGIQPVTSDFRGFLLEDQPVGVRLFGTRANDTYQYNIGWFRRLPKNDARQDEFGAGLPANDLFLANLYWQDSLRPGLTSEFILLYDRSRAPGTRILGAAAAAADATFESRAPHDYDVVYLGYGADGHIGRVNLTASMYEVLGREAQGTFIAGATRVEASFAALELSRDFDWLRVRGSLLHASGDGQPFDHAAHGFDGSNQAAVFAGSDSSFLIHQALPLELDAIALKQRDSLFLSLRPLSDPGQSNYTNPGVDLLGAGADFDLAPVVRISADANEVWFDRTQTIEALLGTGGLARRIGTDVSADVLYRPFNSQNLIVRLSAAELIGTPTASAITGSRSAYSLFFNLIATY